MTQDTSSAIRPLVFIVDDERIIGDLVGSYLRMEGMEVAIFTKPVEALAAFKAANPKPSVLLTDFQMPGMTGLELISACRLLDPHIKTISISGSMTAEDIDASGVVPDRFVRKPFMPSDLLQPIWELLEMAPAK